VDLEAEILATVKSSTEKAIAEALSGYNGPLTKLVGEVVEAHRGELRNTFEEAIVKSINSEEFKSLVEDAFHHKLAKALVSSFDSSVDKAFSAMKSDPTIRAKAIIAVENIIKESAK